jgi:hypothetical protein
VQDLHADPAARLVHGVGHQPMTIHLVAAREFSRERLGPARTIGRDAAGHEQARPAARPLREVRRELGIIPRTILEAGVHRSHDDAIRQPRESEIERGEQMWMLHCRE